MKKIALIAALAAVMLVAAATFAVADTSSPLGSGTGGTVTVKANVSSKLAMTITTPDNTQTVDFGTVDPGSTYSGTKSVGLNVKSNKAYDLSKSITDSTPIGLTTSFLNLTGEAKTISKDYTDNYTLTVPWDANPGAQSATVVYTATQQ